MNPGAHNAVDRGGDRRFDRVVAAAGRGDDAAIAELFAELHPRLLRFLRARSGQAADDLAGEVWLAVAKLMDRFDGDWDDFRALFFVVARRRLADHHRANHRRRAVIVANDFDERSTATTAGSDEFALEHISGEQAAAFVASVLSSDQAEVVLLRVLGDLDAEQVGAIMHRSAGWVRVTQHRALRLLASYLPEHATVTP